jgi:N4-gp56 family major capsid protein
MAVGDTAFPINHPLAVKLWSRKLFRETIAETYLSRFMGTSEDSAIVVMDELTGKPGDKVTYGLRKRLSGPGITEGPDNLEGNEEILDFEDDSLYINDLDHAVRIKGRISEKRVPYNLRAEAKDALKQWYTERLEVSFFNQVLGNTAATDPRYTGLNAVTAPTPAYHIRAGGLANEAAVEADNTAIFDVNLLRAAKQRLLMSPNARPIRYRGKPYWLAFLHPFAVEQLWSNTERGSWLDVNLTQLAGNGADDNNIFTGALGVYDGIVLHESEYVTQGNDGTDPLDHVYRSVVMGAGAVHAAFADSVSGEKITWVEERFDYARKFGISAQMTWGLKKTRFDGVDFSAAVISHYGAAL